DACRTRALRPGAAWLTRACPCHGPGPARSLIVWSRSAGAGTADAAKEQSGDDVFPSLGVQIHAIDALEDVPSQRDPHDHVGQDGNDLVRHARAQLAALDAPLERAP